MRRPVVPALVCLLALGCSHRHLLLMQAPVGTRAMADQVGTAWRITLLVQGAGWRASSSEPELVLDCRDEGGLTRIQWTVPAERWRAEADFPVTLRLGEAEQVLVVRNRSREAQVAEGIGIGVAAVAIVALAVASGRGHGGSGHRSSAARPGPNPAPSPRPPLRPPAPAGRLDPGHPVLLPLSIDLPVPQPPVDLARSPLVAVEPLAGETFPGPLSSVLVPVAEGWEVEVALQGLPDGEAWTAAGAGFQVRVVRAGDELRARWILAGMEQGRDRVFELSFQGPGDRVCRALVRISH